MGGDHTGRTVFAGLGQQRLHHALGVERVQGRRRLISQHQLRPMGQSPRTADPLALAHRQRRRALGQLIADLQLLSQTRPSQLSLATSSANAAKLRQMMVGVVESGTGWRAKISGVTVGGKTGTANSDNVRTPYAWFTAWADDPDVAVCVFVQDAEMEATDVAGGRVAAPIAKAVIEALR